MNYTIKIPRDSFDGLCRYLQTWGEIYSVPGAVVFKGMLRNEPGRGNAVAQQDAAVVAAQFNTASNGLGRCKVLKNEATLDLRDLSEEEQDALRFVSRIAKLKPQQARVMQRFLVTLEEFLNLPAMVRLAIAAE